MIHPKNLERLVLAHRYRYYVLNDPVLSDFDYDALERIALAVVAPSSPLFSVGSDLASSYPFGIATLATNFRAEIAERAKEIIESSRRK